MSPEELEGLAAASRLGPNAVPGPDGVMGTPDDGQGEPIGEEGVQQRLDAYNQGKQQGQQQPGQPGQQQPGQQGQPGAIPGDIDGDGTTDPQELEQLLADPQKLNAALDSPQAGLLAKQLVEANPQHAATLNQMIESGDGGMLAFATPPINDPATQQKMIQVLTQQYPQGIPV
jgi:hypothetical protein